MSEHSKSGVLGSGLIALTPEAIERLPEDAGHYRLRSSGQRIMFIGHAGDLGLRETLRQVGQSHVVAGIATLEYSTADSSEAAAEAAEREIRELKPLYNMGFGRYRNSDTSLPKTGHSIRKAMQNP